MAFLFALLDLVRQLHSPVYFIGQICVKIRVQAVSHPFEHPHHHISHLTFLGLYG